MKTITYSDLLALLADDSTKPASVTIVDVFAEWCKPCHRMTPVLEQFEIDFDLITFVKLDADHEDSHQYMADMKISSIPTLLLYQNGDLVEVWDGGQDSNEIERWIVSSISVPLTKPRTDTT